MFQATAGNAHPTKNALLKLVQDASFNGLYVIFSLLFICLVSLVFPRYHAEDGKAILGGYRHKKEPLKNAFSYCAWEQKNQKESKI
ncbi:MAG: hypothetical protein ACHBN1_14730 [Heteroscytonema crispum UTEX LB 1556]